MDYPFTLREIILLSALLIFAVVQFYYYLIVYMRPVRHAKQAKTYTDTKHQPPVSIIVYARNEYSNLERNLPHLLNQDYPRYEVIVINDGSTDASDDVLTRLERTYSNLYHTFIPQESKYLSRRKLSLTLGIKAAKHDILFFIEANCRPMNNQWLATMSRRYDEKTTILLGYCAYTTAKGLMHKLVGYDNLLTGVQYISSALAGHPYSGNGRNLSYRKELFFANKGFSHSLNLHAGDDDLFVNRSATGANTVVEYAPSGMTEMEPVETFTAWKDMKITRASTRRHYHGRQVLFYRMENLTAVLFLISFISVAVDGLLYNPILIAAAAVIYLSLYITKAAVADKLSILLQQKKISGWLPLLEATRMIVGAYIFVCSTFRSKRAYTFSIGSK